MGSSTSPISLNSWSCANRATALSWAIANRGASAFLRLLNAKGWNVLVSLLLGLHIRDIDCAFKLYDTARTRLRRDIRGRDD